MQCPMQLNTLRLNLTCDAVFSPFAAARSLDACALISELEKKMHVHILLQDIKNVI